MQPSKPFWGHLAALFTLSVWGITYISTKVLLVSFSPVEILFYRLVLALAALSIASPPRLGGWQFSREALRGEGKAMLAGLLGVTLYFICQNVALTYTLAANASVLISVAPLFTALASRAVFGERLKTNFLLGFSAAITGIMLIAFNGSVVLKLNPLGDLLSVMSALVWALYSITVRSMNSGQASVIASTRRVIFYGLLFLLPLLPLFQFQLGLARLAEPANLFNLLFLGVFASGVCFVTWNFAVHALGPVKTSVYIYLGPVITIIASALLLGETITLLPGIGMALILAGMAISEYEGGRRPDVNVRARRYANREDP